MMLSDALYLFGGLEALATLLMLFQRNPVKAALLMLAALLSTAGLYLALSAQLLAALQLILYAGAVMVLFVVALAAMPQAWRDKPAPPTPARVLGLAAAAILLTELLKLSAALKARPSAAVFSDTGVLPLALQLFGRFAFQFELLSLVILTSIVAAVVLAGKRRTQP